MADKKGPVFLVIPRKLIITWITINAVLFVGIIFSYQYTNYVARQLCGVIRISNNAYDANPNPSATGKTLATEFHKLAKKYHCS